MAADDEHVDFLVCASCGFQLPALHEPDEADCDRCERPMVHVSGPEAAVQLLALRLSGTAAST